MCIHSGHACQPTTHTRYHFAYKKHISQKEIYLSCQVLSLTGAHFSRLLILVNKDIPVTAVSDPDQECQLEKQHVTLHLPQKDIQLLHVYRHYLITLQHDMIKDYLYQENAIVFGDFNSHHPHVGQPGVGSDILVHGRGLTDVLMESPCSA